MPTKDRIAFLSRQTGSLSLDFELLRDALVADLQADESLKHWRIVTEFCSDKTSFAKRLMSNLKQLYLVATSKACVIEGYVPAVSIPIVDADLFVLQIWHGLGTIKKFGWQAVGTKAGRDIKTATDLCMHHNYSKIVAGGRGSVVAFAAAFGYPEDDIVPLGLPRTDYLLHPIEFARSERARQTVEEYYPDVVNGKINILYLPTFRRGAERAALDTYADSIQAQLDSEKFNFLTSHHPVASNSSFKAKSIDLLPFADYVITDYSTVAFEAYLLGKKTLFYTPDIEEYLQSPGLEIDVQSRFPNISFKQAGDLAKYIYDDLEDPQQHEVDSRQFKAFCKQYLEKDCTNSTQAIVQLFGLFCAAMR